MISTGILFVISIQAILIHFGGNDSGFSLKWYHPISIILAGLLCSIPSLVFERYEQMEKGKFIGIMCKMSLTIDKTNVIISFGREYIF